MVNLILPFADPELEAGAPAISLSERFNHMSEDEFYEFCQRNPDLKFERRADGTIEYLNMTGGTTGNRNSELLTDLTIWNRQGRPGFVFDSSTGFRLPNGAVRSPDAAWVRAETWQTLPAGQQEKFPPLCPDFVVELLSPSDAITELVAKMQEYIANGCRLAWLIDPKMETARVFRADGSVSVVKSFDETLSGEDVLPGFAFALATLR
ncbi:Uma2 family endonuclease [Hymenobacter artigasi]|uniref:Uma2 family endonuclease n=1 Tax=Hymenobacter artigasi TaxID=2719616 RepID=A0ABX1HIA6_9BACT|nr:Uma2 family endonuclease [Hymenobacter artigasi]NKI88877.1 Uma2 family endonuclease [Hymenobacter artigasi]